MESVELKSIGDTRFAILADGTRVGKIRFHERGDGGYIQKVFVKEQERDNGYATAAIEQLVSRYDGEITSAPTASPAMRHIIRDKIGFEFKEKDEVDIWVYR